MEASFVRMMSGGYPDRQGGNEPLEKNGNSCFRARVHAGIFRSRPVGEKLVRNSRQNTQGFEIQVKDKE